MQSARLYDGNILLTLFFQKLGVQLGNYCRVLVQLCSCSKKLIILIFLFIDRDYITLTPFADG